jgi:hypothetical protein
MTKTLIDTTRRGLEAKIVGVEFRVERGPSRRTENGAGVAQNQKFDESTSWALFRRQFETMAEHNGRKPGD